MWIVLASSAEKLVVSRSDRILVAAGGGVVVLVVAAASMLLLPVEGQSVEAGDAANLIVSSSAPGPSATVAAPTGGATIVVDVEGAVAQPGVRELPGGSRIADAIAAAGGYGPDVDLDAAAASINLAQPLSDGEQVVIPRIGAKASSPPSPGAIAGGEGTTGGGGGLVNLNTATPEELEALPGIGAVTVQKIVAARQERPFASLDDAVTRGVIHRGQLEDIQGVATAG
jgi:competence protein ComEA